MQADKGPLIHPLDRPLIDYNGFVQLAIQTIIVSACPIDVTFFPFDVQVCNITFTSHIHNMSRLKFTTQRQSSKGGTKKHTTLYSYY